MFTLRRLADARPHGRARSRTRRRTSRVCDHIVYPRRRQDRVLRPAAQALEFFGVEDFADIYAATDEPDKPEERRRGVAGEVPGLAAVPEVRRSSGRRARPRRRRASSTPRRSGARRRSTQSRVAAARDPDASLPRADARRRKNLALLLLQAPIIGLLLVLVSRVDGMTTGRIEAKKVIFMLATTGVWFGVINAAREICKEAPVLRRERLAGLHPSAYLASKLVVLTVLVLVQSALLLGVLAVRMHVPVARHRDAGAARDLSSRSCSRGIAGIALGLCMSAIAATPDKAMRLIPIVLVPQVLFAGSCSRVQASTKAIGWVVSARAGVDALSAIVSMNNLQPNPDAVRARARPHRDDSCPPRVGDARRPSLSMFSGLAWWKLRK